VNPPFVSCSLILTQVLAHRQRRSHLFCHGGIFLNGGCKQF
jgi:hypothetical protein